MKQDLLWETWMNLAYHNLSAKLTTSERGRINKALKELREIGATPEELKRKWSAYKTKWPKLGDPTITALTGNWNSLETRRSPAKLSYSLPTPTKESRQNGMRLLKDTLPLSITRRLHTED